MKKIASLVVLFSSTILLFGVMGSVVNAQGVGIKVSPVKIEELVEPGQILKERVKITNESDAPKTFYPYIKDFKAGDESGAATLIDAGSEEGNYLASWIEIENKGIDFGPREEKEIEFLLKVPANVGPGGYYGAVLFGTEPPKISVNSEDKGAGIAISQQTACLLLFQVKGDILEEARVREFNTNKDLYGTPFSTEFLLRIENVGNVHIKPYGTINIKNILGKEVAVLRVNEKGGNVLPHSIRKYSANWDGKLAFGRYKAVLGLTYGTSAENGGQGKQSLYGEKTFWIVPWKIVIPVILGTIFLIALFSLLLRLYKNKAVRKAMEEAGLGHIRYVKKYEGPSPVLHAMLIILAVLIILSIVFTVIYFIFFA